MELLNIAKITKFVYIINLQDLTLIKSQKINCSKLKSYFELMPK